MLSFVVDLNTGWTNQIQVSNLRNKNNRRIPCPWTFTSQTVCQWTQRCIHSCIIQLLYSVIIMCEIACNDLSPKAAIFTTYGIQFLNCTILYWGSYFTEHLHPITGNRLKIMSKVCKIDICNSSHILHL